MTTADLNIDLDVGDVGTAMLRQGFYWKIRGPAGELQLVHLDQLSREHQRRLLAWLRRNAETMQAHERRTVARLYQRGRMLAPEFAAAMRPLETVLPEVWIEDTALVRRLVQLVPAEPARPRRHRFLPRRWTR